MDLVLKQFDDILLHFTAERTIDGIDVAITSTNKDKATYLPLGMKPTRRIDSSLLSVGLYYPWYAIRKHRQTKKLPIQR